MENVWTDFNLPNFTFAEYLRELEQIMIWYDFPEIIRVI